MSLKEPIVEGAYYQREDGQVIGPSRWLSIRCLELWVGDNYYRQSDGELMGVSDSGERNRLGLTRRVWITHTDPAEVVAELRGLTSEYRESHSMHSQSMADGFDTAADLVAEKLGLTPER